MFVTNPFIGGRRKRLLTNFNSIMKYHINRKNQRSLSAKRTKKQIISNNFETKRVRYYN